MQILSSPDTDGTPALQSGTIIVGFFYLVMDAIFFMLNNVGCILLGLFEYLACKPKVCAILTRI